MSMKSSAAHLPFTSSVSRDANSSAGYFGVIVSFYGTGSVSYQSSALTQEGFILRHDAFLGEVGNTPYLPPAWVSGPGSIKVTRKAFLQQDLRMMHLCPPYHIFVTLLMCT
jgi:hypothetical protein